ncbi:MAG: hypothetical protein ACFFBD_18155 [Candidatus Hodarchaeota archaeon]
MQIIFANATHGWAVSSRKEWSVITTTGGHMTFPEVFINLGFGLGSFSLISAFGLFVINRLQKKQIQYLKNARPPLSSCPRCGQHIIGQTKFCGTCGAPLPNYQNNQAK